MIAKAVEELITNTYIKKLRLHHEEYTWIDDGVLVRNDGHTMLCLIFKIINSNTSIGVSNLKYEIEKANLAKFGNNVKYLLGEMSSNQSIIIDKGEHHDDYVRHIFRYILSGPNSTFNFLIERTKYDWDTGT